MIFSHFSRLSILLACVFIVSCSSMGVSPWERGILAKPEMEMTDNAMDLAFDAHIYFSKEASSGGEGFAGGGCGCN